MGEAPAIHFGQWRMIIMSLSFIYILYIYISVVHVYSLNPSHIFEITNISLL